jgi:hypothetical protein
VKKMSNSIPLYNLDLTFSINHITASKEANTIIFSKCTGQYSGQFLYSRKTEEIKENKTENF